jgi:hypothetical protein
VHFAKPDDVGGISWATSFIESALARDLDAEIEITDVNGVTYAGRVQALSGRTLLLASDEGTRVVDLELVDSAAVIRRQGEA